MLSVKLAIFSIALLHCVTPIFMNMCSYKCIKDGGSNIIETSKIISATAVEPHSLEWKRENGDFELHAYPKVSSNLFGYTLCDRKNNNCSASLDYVDSDGSMYKKDKCTIDFNTKYYDSNNFLSVHRNKFVFTYNTRLDGEVETNEKLSRIEQWYRVLNMATCKLQKANHTFELTSDSELNEEILQNVNVFPACINDTIEVFMYDENTCDGARCRITYNSEGNIIGEPVSYFPKNYFTEYKIKIYRLWRSSSSKNYFAVLRPHNFDGYRNYDSRNGIQKTILANEIYQALKNPTVRVVYARGDGETTELLRIDDKDLRYGSHPENSNMIDFNEMYNHFSVCFVIGDDNTTLKCFQFDSEGKEVLNVTLNYVYQIQMLKIRNFADGIRLLTASPADQRANQFYLRSISPKGELGNNVAINNLDCLKVKGFTSNDQTDASIDQPQIGMICITLKCFRERKNWRTDESSIVMIRKCFADDY